MKRSSRRTAGDGGLYQRADGMWCASLDLGYDAAGKRRRWVGRSRTKEGALAKLRAARSEQSSTGTVGKRSQTVGAWLDHWLAEIVRPTKRPKTYAEYERCVRLHLKPRIGRDRLLELTPQRLRTVERAIATEHTPATANSVHKCIRAALSAAVSDGVIPRNVAESVTPPTAQAAQREPLTAAQGAILLESLRGDVAASARWTFALCTGLRQGEALGLEWDRVDLAEAVADVSWQLQRLVYDHGCGVEGPAGWPCGRQRGGNCPDRQRVLPDGFEIRSLPNTSLVLTRPKTTRSIRVVPLAPSVVVALKRLRAEDISPGLVWRSTDARGRSKPIDPKIDYADWQSALKAAELPKAPPHITRHTTATLLLEQGVPDKVVQSILGHTRAATTHRYQHVDVGLAREALGKVDAALA